MNQIGIPEWITELSDENLLAVYDVALDIRDEFKADDEIVIPIYRLVARFAPLCPGFSVGFVDRYCELRWKATVMLKSKGVIIDLDIIKGPYRWDSNLRLRLDSETFSQHFHAIEQAYQSRFRDNLSGFESLSQSITNDPLELLRSILLRFHAVAVQMRERHANRPTLDVSDEFDVQDLIHALLRLHFDDIRPEKWISAYAGKALRADLLLKPEKIVVVVKMTRPGLGAKELGEHLVIYKERYSQMSGCDTLVCFVYDPENRISNAAWLELELSEKRESFKVEVIIVPKQY